MTYSVKELNNYKLPKLNNILYEKYRIIWSIYNPDIQKLLNQYYNMNNYDDLCKHILNFEHKITIPSEFRNIDINFIKSSTPLSHLSLSTTKYYWFQYFIEKINLNINKNNTFAIVTNSDKIILQGVQFKQKCDVIIFPNTEYDTNMDELLYLVKNSDVKIFYEKNKKKYDNILIRNFEFMNSYYLPYFELTKLSSTILLITNGLIKLNKNGNMFINLRIIYVNNTLEKIINLLNNTFKNVIITKSNETLDSNFMIECYDFLDNINDQTFDQLMDLTNKKYTYSLCQFMNYYYYMLETKTPFMYHIDFNTLSKEFKSKCKKISIIDDFDTQNNVLFAPSSKGLFLIQDIKNYYNDFLDNINLLIYQYIDEKNNITNPDFFKKLNYQKLQKYGDIFKKYNIPYDKSVLVYINQYNVSQISKLHSLDNNIKFLLTKTSKFKNDFNFNLNVKKYDYNNELKNLNDMYELVFKVNNLTLNKIKLNDKVPNIVKSVTDNYARGVAKFINQSKQYKINYRISNAFTKMWEMLASVKLLPNQKDKDINVFFIAEAPGQWIHAIDYYIKNKLDNVKSWDWRATTLDPAHPINVFKFGVNKLPDDYGFIKKYPNKWLYGVDKTGDITKTENIRWYQQYVKEWAKPDLVTGGASFRSDNPMIYQRLEYSQVLMVAAVSAKGGNCVIKHFLPYVPDIPETKTANGFFMNYIYLYYLMFEEVYLIKPLSSDPVLGEFYVIGKKFIGLDQSIFEKMIAMLDNFDVNMCFFDKKSIPDHFVKQIIHFIEKLTHLNVNFIEIQNTLLNCLIKKDSVFEKVTECRKYLNQSYMNEIQESKFKKWIEIYDFK